MHRWLIERQKPVYLLLEAQLLGLDLFVVITGGDAPHIGAVTLSIPRRSTHSGRTVSNTSVLSVSGHMDDILFREIGTRLAEELDRTVLVTGGIHVEGATKELVAAIMTAVRKMSRELVVRVKGDGVTGS